MIILPGTGRGTGAAGGGGVPHTLRPEVSLARKLRRTMSLPEMLLWQRLRSNAAGIKFRRQHPVGPFVVDFHCGAASLAIEIDGEAHNRGDRPRRDVERDTFLVQNGVRVPRVSGARILHDLDAAAEAIASYAAAPLHQPLAGPPPRAGEDQE